mgnify:CR=1 FL=1
MASWPLPRLMRTADFDFDLPDDHIALRPAEPRDSARLLVVKDGALEDWIVRDLPGFLRPGDALVFNDTRVIPARLSGVRQRIGAEGETLTVEVEATLHHRDAPDVWSAFMKPGKRIKPGDRIRFGAEVDGACLLGRLDATVVDMRFVKPMDEALVREMADSHELLVTIEENAIMGGAGAAVSEFLARENVLRSVLHLGLPDVYVEHAKPSQMLAECGLDAAGIEASVRQRMQLLGL